VIRPIRLELAHIKAVAFDLDGVLYESDAPVQDAARTVAAVRENGRAVRFVTNTTSLSRRLIAARLQRLGFDASVDEIFCPSLAAASWLRQARRSAALFVRPEAREDFTGIVEDGDHPGAVVVGDLQEAWTFQRLNEAFRLVFEAGARLVGLGRTRYWKGPQGLQLDAGPFVAALEQATGSPALVFGKPELAFFAALADDLQMPPDRIAMVGDDVVTDVGASMRAGFFGVLARTGKFRPSDLEGTVRPDLVVESVAALVQS
jgi:HAD superfamily hydrolase (TIGR01458 family)